MLKPVIAAAAMLAIAGSSLVYAQQSSGGQPGFGGGHGGWHHGQHHRPSAQDLAAFTDARIAALKAGLELTPDQAKDWPAFEQAVRDMAQLRIKRIEAREARMQSPQQGQNPQQGQGGPFDRLGHRADHLAAVSAALKKVAETGAPLYQSLNDAQKERFKTLAHMLRPHHRQMAFNNRDGGWGQGGRGGGPNGQGFGHHRRFGENDHDPAMNGSGNTGGDQGSQL